MLTKVRQDGEKNKDKVKLLKEQNLYDELKTSTEKFQFLCEVCEKTFVNMHELKSHNKKCHPKVSLFVRIGK